MVHSYIGLAEGDDDVTSGQDQDVDDGESEGTREQLTVQVDDQGRIEVPQRVLERFDVGPDGRIPAVIVGSVLRIGDAPGERLETATADRDDWTDTTPMDAGETLFGSADGE